MRNQVPPELSRLLSAGDTAAREAAWEALVAACSPPLLRVAQAHSRGRDAAMGEYAYLLEQLRDQDFRLLRAWAADGRSRFSTWLVVVARRLCLDHHRRRYGRLRIRLDMPGAAWRRGTQYGLADLLDL